MSTEMMNNGAPASGEKKQPVRVQKRAMKAGLISAVIIAALLIILVAANLLLGKADSKYTKFDLTPNEMFDISDQTEAIISGLQDDVNIYWLTASGSEDTTIGLLLERYQAISDRLKVEKIDPQEYPTVVSRYTDNPQNNSLVVYNNDRFKYLDFYSIYEYDYSDYYKDGTSVSINFAGESVISSAINYVATGASYKMYLLTGHNEAALPETYKTAVRNENIELAELSLAEGAAVPEDASAVLINAPASDLSDAEKDALDAYLDNGGDLYFISQPVDGTRLTNFDALMSRYGIEASDGVVIEGYDKYFSRDLPYYLIPTIVPHPITAPLVNNGFSVIFPIAQGLKHSAEHPENVTAYPLLQTSEFAFSKMRITTDGSFEKEDGDISGPFFLGMAMEEETENGLSRAVWLTTGHIMNEFVNDETGGANEELFLNAADWLCGQDDSVISVRSKRMTRDILRIDSGTATVLAIILIGVIPILYFAVGMVIRLRRKRR